MTEYLAEQPEIDALSTFDPDPAFVAIARTKAKELGLTVVREILELDQDATCHLPWVDGAFDLVLAIGVVEHLPERHRRAQVDEYWRVLARGGHIVFLDTPNRYFPWETHSVNLPFVQWLPPRLAYSYARLGRPGVYGSVPFENFIADGTGWRNATLAECLPSSGSSGVVDITEEAGYGLRFFRDTARSRTRHALLPLFGAAARILTAAGQPPSLVLPYLNLLFQRTQ
jgi:SAM-dependent methyltransferase